MRTAKTTVKSTLQALRKRCMQAKTKKPLVQHMESISSSISLLNLTSLPKDAATKLAAVLRSSLVPLYLAFKEPALDFAAALLIDIVTGKLHSFHSKEDDARDDSVGWEQILNSLLSGVIDFLEKEESDVTKTAIANALYSPICKYFFGDRCESTIGASLRCTAYTLLSDTAAQHSANQNRLRNEAFLSGSTLGGVISKTREFAVLEVLLNLFARLLPSSSNSKQKFESFIEDVFLKNLTDFGEYREKIVKLLKQVVAKDWEETATKLFDILASADISFPQPFDLREVTVCRQIYPQPEVSDRLYVDKEVFFINVPQEDGMYESLQISYGTVKEIDIHPGKGDTVLVTVHLKNSPRLGDQPLTTSAEAFNFSVEIQVKDLERFKAAIRHRSMASFITRLRVPLNQKSSISESSAKLDFDNYEDKRSDLKHSEAKVLEVPKLVERHISEQISASLAPQDNIDASPSSPAKAESALIPSVSNKPLQPKVDNTSTNVPQRTTASSPGGLAVSARAPKIQVIDVNESDSEVVKALPKPDTKRRRKRVKSHDDQAAKDVKTPAEVDETESLSVKKGRSLRKDGDQKPNVGKTKDCEIEVEHIEIGASSNLVEAVDVDQVPSTPPKRLRARAPHLSSPTSKVSQMKKKSAHDEGPNKAKALKRPLEHIVLSDDVEPNQKKKKRTKITSEEDGKSANGSIKPTSNKFNTDTAATKAAIGADAPGQLGPSNSEEFLSPQVDIISSSPVKKAEMRIASVNGRTKKKKENVALITPKKRRAEQPKFVSITRREPLETVSHDTNTLDIEPADKIALCESMELPTHQKVVRRSAHSQTEDVFESVAPLQKTFHPEVGPALEDIIPRGAKIKARAVDKPSKQSYREARLNSLSKNIEDARSLPVIQIGSPLTPLSSSDEDNFAHRQLNGVLSNTKASETIGKQGTMGVTKEVIAGERSPGVVEATQEDESVGSDGADMDHNDITEDDIREVLQTLRNRRLKLRAKPVSHLELSTKDKSESDDEREKLVPRSRVKFDDKLRYKSASFEKTLDGHTPKDSAIFDSEGRYARASKRLLTEVVAERDPRFTKGKPLLRASESKSSTKQEVPPKEPGMEDIVAVLNAIQSALIVNISNKSRAVRSDIRVARDRLLQEGICDMHVLREQSVEHFNGLFSLETKYANINRKLGIRYDVASGTNEDICRYIQETMHAHDRSTTLKQMPQSLFGTSLPGSLVKYLMK